jgi:hypothetical protein
MIGDKNNFIERLKQVLPTNWYGEIPETKEGKNNDVLVSLLSGFATLDSFIYSIMEYVKEQMRIQTATDDNLDLIACDYFGDFLIRFPGTNDTDFRRQILATLLEEMATREGMRKAIFNLTGYYPIIWEPFNPDDTGAYNVPNWGYNTGGGYGGHIPYNFWITVYVDGSVMDSYGSLNTETWGYNGIELGDNGAYGNPSLLSTTLTYEQVLAVINRVKVGGTVPHLTLVVL